MSYYRVRSYKNGKIYNEPGVILKDITISDVKYEVYPEGYETVILFSGKVFRRYISSWEELDKFCLNDGFVQSIGWKNGICETENGICETDYVMTIEKLSDDAAVKMIKNMTENTVDPNGTEYSEQWTHEYDKTREITATDIYNNITEYRIRFNDERVESVMRRV